MTAQELYQTAQDCGLISTPPNKTRKRPHVMLRHCIMYELIKHQSLEIAGVKIGELYKTKYPFNHSTLINAKKVVEQSHDKRNGFYIHHDNVSKYIRHACIVLGIKIEDIPDRRIKPQLNIIEAMELLHFDLAGGIRKAYYDEGGFYCTNLHGQKIYPSSELLIEWDGNTEITRPVKVPVGVLKTESVNA